MDINWINIEEDPDVIQDEIEEALNDVVDGPNDTFKDDYEDYEVLAPPEVDEVSYMVATEALYILHNYCFQQEFNTKVSLMFG